MTMKSVYPKMLSSYLWEAVSASKLPFMGEKKELTLSCNCLFTSAQMKVIHGYVEYFSQTYLENEGSGLIVL